MQLDLECNLDFLANKDSLSWISVTGSVLNFLSILERLEIKGVKAASVCLTATFVLASGNAFEVDNAEVQPLLQPDAIHDADHLKSQHVLP